MESSQQVNPQQYPIQPSETQSPPLSSGSKNKVGFGIFFIVIVIILSIGILNYFNILPLSMMFPNQLGWLPHRQQSNNLTIKQLSNVTIAPTISPSASLLEPAKQTLTNFLPTILDSSLLPNSSEITLEQDKNLSTTFIGSWDTKESTGAAILIVTDGKSISQFYLSVPIFHSMPPSVKLASTITSNLFSVKPKGTWGCKPLYSNNTYCENFWEEADGTRRGLGLQGLFTQEPNLIVGQPTAMIVFCEHTKDSKLYSWKSCQFEFAKTGVVQ